METEGNPLVFSLLGAVAVHLFFWSRRQSRKLQAFARACGQVREVVNLDGATLFRTMELLDLNP